MEEFCLNFEPMCIQYNLIHTSNTVNIYLLIDVVGQSWSGTSANVVSDGKFYKTTEHHVSAENTGF